MVNDPKAAIDRLVEQIETAEVLDEDERDALLDFNRQLSIRRAEYSHQRREKLLRHCAIMSGLSQRHPENVLPDVRLVDTLEDKRARDDLLAWINERYDSPSSNRDYRVAIRMFGRHITDGDEVPEILQTVPTTTSRNGPPLPDPSEMLDWHDDIRPMIDATRNSRDAALIAVAWDSGARYGEHENLTLGDVTDHDHGLQITVDGKTGQRSITLMPSVPFLNQWMADHPGKRDPDAPLWSKLSTPEQPSYQQLRKCVGKPAERAGVRKPTTFRNFRKSSAAYLASQGMNQAHIEQHHGWRHGSDVAARYIRVFSADADKQLAKVHGVELDEADEPDPIGPVGCPRCGRENPRDESACVFCGQVLEAGAAERLEENEREVKQVVLQFANDHPDLVNDVGDLERLMEFFDGDADLAADADRIATVLGG